MRTLINIFIFTPIFILIIFKHKLYANECGKYFDNFNSPLCTNAKYIIYTGTILTAGLYLTKHKTSYEIRDETIERDRLHNWGDLANIIGYGYLNVAYILGAAIAGNGAASEHMAESSLYTLLSVLILKTTVSEGRPGYPEDKDSFPSGHTAEAFVFASVIGSRHGIAWGFPAYMFATYISMSRIYDDWHYLHDVVAGATIGLSYAWGIYLNHEKYKKPYWMGTAMPYIFPYEDGVKIAFNFRF